MDVNKIIAELREERENIDQSIIALERIATGRGKRRGRPPKWMVEAKQKENAPKRRGRPPKNEDA